MNDRAPSAEYRVALCSSVSGSSRRERARAPYLSRRRVRLAHYFEYRDTKYVDAWWAGSASSEERTATVATLESALRTFGEVRKRAWGYVVSIELQVNQATVFSFQIAQRSAELEIPVSGVWPGGIGVDSFSDLVASKMVALVERGAPRDFLDIYTLCTKGQCAVPDCWQWWTS